MSLISATELVTELFDLQVQRATLRSCVGWRDGVVTRFDIARAVDDVVGRLRPDVPSDGPVCPIVLASPSPIDVLVAVQASARVSAPLVLANPNSVPASVIDALGDNLPILRSLDDVDQAHDWARARSLLRSDEIVFFSSGATGTPKAIVHTHASVLAALWLLLVSSGLAAPASNADEILEQLHRHVSACDGSLIESGPLLVSCLPPWTIAGFTMLIYASLVGAQLRVEWPFDASAVLDTIADEGATSVGVAPFLAQMLLREQLRSPRDMSTLLVLGLGASKVPAELSRMLERVFGCVVSIGYGMTETGGAISRSKWSDTAADRTGTVGEPLPGVDVRIDDTSNGELLIRTPALMRAYFDRGGKRVDVAPGTWFRSGDIAQMSREGLLRIHGRISDRIIRGGRTIDPLPIEEVLRSHPTVADCVVIGTASRVAGEEDLSAAVVVEDGCVIDARELRRYCGVLLARGDVPSRYVQITTIPRTVDGTPVRREVLTTVEATYRP